MFVIDVIPIAKGIGTSILSYFTSKDIPIGAIVTIPLRKKIIHGIVLSKKNAEDLKSEIKRSEFALKKVDQIKSTEFFPSYFMEMITETAEYYATSPGSIMNVLVPDYILKNINKFKKSKLEENVGNTKISNEKYAVQGDDDERYSNWKTLIRQEFAKKKSVMIVMPTREDTEHAYELLEKGIGEYVYVLNSSLTSKEIVERWNSVITEKHPVVVIATGAFLSIPRHDIESIVIERENSRSYKIPRRPYLDIRHVAEVLSSKKGAKLFFADNFLRMETLWRESIGQILPSSPFKFRSLSTALDLLVDMKKDKSSKEFKVLSDEVLRLILKTKNESEQMLILGTRRGVAPTTICGDCQSIVVCNNCNSPVVLHTTGEKRFFMCHRCGERRPAEEYCKTCSSWKLQTIGIGIDLIIEKIKDKFPDINIFKIDSDSTKSNEKTIKSIVSQFKSSPGSILIGTEMMLQYIHEKVENSAIISLDSLFALPDFRIQEKIMYLLTRIRTLTTKNFIVQTRKIDEKVFEYGMKGNLNDFYRNEIENRKNFNYPPFSTLIKLTLEGKKELIIKEMELAQNILDPFEVEVFPAFTHTVKGNYVLHGLIRIPNKENTKQSLPIDLVSKVNLLSPAISVKVDPESLL